jgi:hypothetical protein
MTKLQPPSGGYLDGANMIGVQNKISAADVVP